MSSDRMFTVYTTIFTTFCLLFVILALPLFFVKMQRANTLMLAQLHSCHLDSNEIWRQISHESYRSTGTRQKRSYGSPTGAYNPPGYSSGKCCSCQQGQPGPPGEKGPDGEPGNLGTVGSNGRNGLNGQYVLSKKSDELPCQKCASAPPGPPGHPGNKGPQGPAGPQGTPGDDAQPGLQGPQGPQGVRGQPGDIGQQGPEGDRGRVLNGAPQGPPGRAGRIGPRGKAGTAGRDGRPGLPGQPGPRGSQGERGQKGSRGDQGPHGAIGSPGVRGSCNHCSSGPRTSKDKEETRKEEGSEESAQYESPSQPEQEQHPNEKPSAYEQPEEEQPQNNDRPDTSAEIPERSRTVSTPARPAGRQQNRNNQPEADEEKPEYGLPEDISRKSHHQTPSPRRPSPPGGRPKVEQKPSPPKQSKNEVGGYPEGPPRTVIGYKQEPPRVFTTEVPKSAYNEPEEPRRGYRVNTDTKGPAFVPSSREFDEDEEGDDRYEENEFVAAQTEQTRKPVGYDAQQLAALAGPQGAAPPAQSTVARGGLRQGAAVPQQTPQPNAWNRPNGFPQQQQRQSFNVPSYPAPQVQSGYAANPIGRSWNAPPPPGPASYPQQLSPPQSGHY